MALVTAITVLLLQASLFSCHTLRPVSLIHDGSSEVTVVSSGRLKSKLTQIIPILEGLDSADSKITKIKKLIPVYDKLNKWRIKNKKALLEIMPSVKNRNPLAYILSNGGKESKNAAATLVNNDNSATSFDPHHTTYQSSNTKLHSNAKHITAHETKHKSSRENHSDHNTGKQTHGLMENCKHHSLLCIGEGLNTEKNGIKSNKNNKKQTLTKDVPTYGPKGNSFNDDFGSSFESDFDISAEVSDKSNSHDIETPYKNTLHNKFSILENDLNDDSDFDSSFKTTLVISADVSDENDSSGIDSQSKNTLNKRSGNKINLLTQNYEAVTPFDFEIPELEEVNHKYQHHSHHKHESHDQPHAEYYHSAQTDKHGLANENKTVYVDNNNYHSKNEHHHIKHTPNDKMLHQHSVENSHDSKYEDVNTELNNANTLNTYVSNDDVNTEKWQSEGILETRHRERHSHYVPEIHHSSHHIKTTSPHIEPSLHTSHAKKQLSETYEKYENFVDNSFQDNRDGINAKSVKVPTYESASKGNIDSNSASLQPHLYNSFTESNESDLIFDSESTSSDSESNEFDPKSSSLELASNESGSKSNLLDSVSSKSVSESSSSDSELNESVSELSSSNSEFNGYDSESSSSDSELNESVSESSFSDSELNGYDSESSSSYSESNESDSELSSSDSELNESESKSSSSDSELNGYDSESSSSDSELNESESKSSSSDSELNGYDSESSSSDSELNESDSESSSLNSESNESDVIPNVTKSDSESNLTNSALDSSKSESDFETPDAESASSISDSESTESYSNSYNSAENIPDSRAESPNFDNESIDSKADSDYMSLSSEHSQKSDFMDSNPLSSESIKADLLSSKANTESNTKPSESNSETTESFAEPGEPNEYESISKQKYSFDSDERFSDTLFSDISPEFFLEPSHETETSFNPALELSEMYHKELASSEEQQLSDSDLQSLTSDFDSVITKLPGIRKFGSESDFSKNDDLPRKTINSLAVTRQLYPNIARMRRKNNNASPKACNSVNRANQDSKHLASKARKKSYKLSFLFYR